MSEELREKAKVGYDAIMDKIDYVMDSRGELHTSFMLMFRDDKADHRLYRRPSEARLASATEQEAVAKLLWERFSPGHEVEWPSTHAAEYRLAAEDIGCLVERSRAAEIANLRELTERQSYEFDQLDAICKGLQEERARLEADYLALLSANEGMRKALTRLVESELATKVRSLVAGWNGEGVPEEYRFGRHPDSLGVTLPTDCGSMYMLDEVLAELRAALSPALNSKLAPAGEGEANG